MASQTTTSPITQQTPQTQQQQQQQQVQQNPQNPQFHSGPVFLNQPPAFPPVASLYVGDLTGEVSESSLFSVFNNVGPVALIRVCRDPLTHRSLGYAYVNFHHQAHAEEALARLNNVVIGGRPVRVSWVQPDPSLRKSAIGNVFVKNLPKDLLTSDLTTLFSPFGNILSSKIALDSNNVPKGYAFVHFETQEMADNAINSLHNTIFRDKELFVARFVPRAERLKGEEEEFTNLYVKNLDENVDENKLKDVFSVFGPLNSVYIMRNLEGKSKGFGFVDFSQHQHAVAAQQSMNQKALVEGGKLVQVCKFQRKSDREAELKQRFDPRLSHHQPSHSHNKNANFSNHVSGHQHNNNFGRRMYNQNPADQPPESQGVNLYVKNLDETVDEEILKSEFSKFGTVVSSKVMRDDKGITRGYGFVTLKTAEEGQKAVTEMKGQTINNRPVTVAIAHKKDSRGGGAAGGVPGQRNSHYRNYTPAAGDNRDNRNYKGKNSNNNRWTNNQGGSSGNSQQKGGGGRNYSNNRRSYHNNNPNVFVAPTTKSSDETNTDNKTQQQQQLQQQQPQQPKTTDNDVDLSQVPLEQQVNFLAEKIFHRIAAVNADLAPKITGMILEKYDTPEKLLPFLKDESTLKNKISEATELLTKDETPSTSTTASSSDAPISSDAETKKPEPETTPEPTKTETTTDTSDKPKTSEDSTKSDSKDTDTTPSESN